MKKLMLISLSLVTIILTACSSAQAVEPEIIGDPQKGSKIFENQQRSRCMACHTLDGSD